jgi:CRP/FNR family transcriptional regulator, cyclic AMP receptor protein
MSTAMSLKVEDDAGLNNFPNFANLPSLERTFWRGMTIYSIEDMATNLYVVLKGRVKIMRASPEGQQKIISICYRGDIFGELSLALGAIKMRRNEEAVALETARVAEIRSSDFWEAANREPGMMQKAVQYLALRLADAHRQIESLVFDNNHRRLARVLLDLSLEAEKVGERSVRLTHEELAELIGSTREVVTGMMIEFRQQGMIEYKRSNIQTDPARLHQFLKGFETSSLYRPQD